MSNLFTQVLNENRADIINGDVFTEATYADKIPYMKIYRQPFYLPKGKHVGRGEMAFIYSPSITKSIEFIKNPPNALNGNRYLYYYLNGFYKGKIYNKPYREKILPYRKEIYEGFKEIRGIKPYNKLRISNNEYRNMYVDLGKYIEIFTKMTDTIISTKKMVLYWNYLKSVLKTYEFPNFKDRFILVDLDNYRFDLPVTKNLDNPIIMLYYTLFKNPSLVADVDIDFYFFTKTRFLKVNPKRLNPDKNTYKKFKVQMRYITSSVPKFEEEMDEKKILSDEVNEKVVSDFTKITKVSNDASPEEIKTSEDIQRSIQNKVNKVRYQIQVAVDSNEDIPEKTVEKYVKDKTEDEINKDDELIKAIYNQTNRKILPKTPAMSARDKELKEKQKDLVVNGITIKDLEKIDANHMDIPDEDVSNSVSTINKHMTDIRFENFNKTYNDKVMTKDIVNSVLALNNKSIPMYIRDIKVKETSDELNYKDTLTVYLEDANRKRHTVKIDIPKFVDNKFLYLGGNKKIIKNQNFLLPVVKTNEDTVKICTNYNKMTIKRVDTKSVSSVERLKKLIKDSEKFSKMLTFGMAVKINKNYVTTLEYDELSRIITKFKSNSCTLFFNQEEAHKYAEKNNIIIPAKTLFIGIADSKPVFVNTDNQLTIKENKTIVDLMMDHVPSDIKEAYEKIRSPKRLMYVNIRVMKQFIPVISLLCFWEGFSKVLKKMGVKYNLSKSYPSEVSASENIIRFKDTYFTYNGTMGDSLLLNGLRLLNTENYEIGEMDTISPYMDYFVKVFSKATIANALNNYYEFTIDPITLEILKDLNLPTDVVSLMIYAVNLLQDSQFTPEINQSLSRVRSNEIIPAILYKVLASQYVIYRNSNGTKPFSVPQDAVINEILAVPTVEDYSTLNPSLEMEMCHSISAKGFMGLNESRSYTEAKRAYDPSMTGIIAPSTAPDGNVGINKTLTMEPSITSVRGYVKTNEDDLDKLNDVNMFSPTELTMPLVSSIDDPTRLGHSIKQSRHVIPVKDSSPVLISNGMEDVARFHLSSDFVINADEDGEVVDYDEKDNIMMVKYKSGKYRAVNLDGFIVKNGGGGFFLENKLITDLKVGDKFKKNSVLAYHKDFFTHDKFNDTRMNLGTLAKVAIMSTADTYEDSTCISQRLADAAATEMCFQMQAVIGKNSNVTHMSKKGDNISVGDILVQFDTSYDDASLNDLLSKIGDNDLANQIETEAKNNIKSKYNGVIEKIEMYSTVPIEELSPSLRKIFSKYYSSIRRKEAFLEKYDPESKDSINKCGILCTEPKGQIEPSKYGVIKGQNVEDSVLINFYIKHSEPLEVGSKIANFSALKNTINTIIPEGYEPYTKSHPDEPIDTFIAANSILKRMVPSVLLTAIANKCIIELKNKLKDIYAE